jgi:hypothetical protein
LASFETAQVIYFEFLISPRRVGLGRGLQTALSQIPAAGVMGVQWLTLKKTPIRSPLRTIRASFSRTFAAQLSTVKARSNQRPPKQ